MLYAASDRQFPNIGLKLDNPNTKAPPLNASQPLRELEIINDGYNPNQDHDIAESSFTESASAMEYRVRLVEDIELLNGGNKIMVGKGNADLITTVIELCGGPYS